LAQAFVVVSVLSTVLSNSSSIRSPSRAEWTVVVVVVVVVVIVVFLHFALVSLHNQPWQLLCAATDSHQRCIRISLLKTRPPNNGSNISNHSTSSSSNSISRHSISSGNPSNSSRPTTNRLLLPRLWHPSSKVLQSLRSATEGL